MARKNNKEAHAKQQRKEREMQASQKGRQEDKKQERLTKRQLKRIKKKLDQELYERDLGKFREALAPFCLVVKEMEGDGNCLFRAIADQIDGDESLHMVYRQAAVKQIRDNKEMYTPFIEDDETIEEYCDDLKQDGVWGGQLEMNALANSFKFNVVVHQVDNPSMAQTFFTPLGSVPTLHLSYHLGEHYNSVRRGDDPMVRGQSALDEYKIGHDLEKVKAMLSGKGGLRPRDPRKGVEESKEDGREWKFDDAVLEFALALVKLKPKPSKMEVMERTLSHLFNRKYESAAQVTVDVVAKHSKKIQSKFYEFELEHFESLAIGDEGDIQYKSESAGRGATKEKVELDAKYLKHVLERLKKEKETTIDPLFCTLKDLKLVKTPGRNRLCPCNSKERYKKCCEDADIIRRGTIMNEIEQFLGVGGKDSAKGAILLV